MKHTCLEIAQRAGLEGGRKAGNEYLFNCPRHDDKHPSLKINQEKDVWGCFPCGAGGNPWKLAAWIAGVDPDDKDSVIAWLKEKGLLDKPTREIIKEYDYRDVNGELLYQTVRYEPKDFRQRRPDGNGGWIWNLEGVELVPYRLPEWKDKDTVYIVEGENDADSLFALGIPATTNPLGAGKWRREYNQWFSGKKVVILPDSDNPGEKHADTIVEHLFPITSGLKILHLPGLPDKGDVSDWISSGGTLKDLKKVVASTTILTEEEFNSRKSTKSVITDLSSDRDPLKTPEWPIMAVEAYHGLPGEIVGTIDPHTEADPVSVLAHLLVGFGNLIGSRPHALVQNDQHPSRLFAVTVGQSSKGRKGTSWSSPKELFKSIDPDWLANRVRTGLSTGEGLIYHVRDEVHKMEPVKSNRGIDYQDIITDHGESDKRLFCIETEFSNMLKMMGRKENSLSGVIRQCWDDGNLSTLTRNNPLHATSAHVSIVGHTTSEELLRCLSETEQANGFGNRFIFLLVRRSKFLPDGGAVPTATMERLVEKLRTITERVKGIDVVRRDPDAAELWRRIYPALSAGETGLAGNILNRAEAQVLRLSLVYALFDGSSHIKVPHLQAAIAVWDYAASSVKYLFGDKVGNTAADKIVSALIQAPDGLTDDEIGRIFSHHRTREKNLALEELQRSGRISQESIPTTGRPRTVWKVA